MENKEKIQQEVMDLIKLKVKCRIRGLQLDYASEGGKYFESGKQEMEELLRHLENLDYIIADIDCALKYLTDEEKSQFCKIITNLSRMEARHSSQA